MLNADSSQVNAESQILWLIIIKRKIHKMTNSSCYYCICLKLNSAIKKEKVRFFLKMLIFLLKTKFVSRQTGLLASPFPMNNAKIRDHK